MIKQIIVFLLFFLVGLFFQATFIHSLAPAAIAPDIVLILIVSLALSYRSVPALVGSFLLGLGADFASGQFLGPSAAGAVVSFMLVVVIANKVYAQKVAAQSILTFLCSIAKSLTYITLIALYTNVSLFSKSTINLILLEALISALVAPIVISVLRWSGAASTARRNSATESSMRWHAQRS